MWRNHFLLSRRFILQAAAAGTAATGLSLSLLPRNKPAALAADEKTWAALPHPSQKTIEPITHTSFSNSVRDVNNQLFRLCATNVRCMLGLCSFEFARAYAFGVYVETASVQQQQQGTSSLLIENINPLPTQAVGHGPFYAASSFQGSRPGYIFTRDKQGLGYYLDQVSKPRDFDLAIPLLIRLNMLHDVDGEHLSHGFDKTLKARLQSAVKPEDYDFVMTQFSKFKHVFSQMEKLPKGTLIDLFKTREGCLTLCVNGQVVETFDSTLLAWAVMDAFIGKSGHLQAQPRVEFQHMLSLILQVKPLSEI